jgi:hypothetical protein
MKTPSTISRHGGSLIRMKAISEAAKDALELV